MARPLASLAVRLWPRVRPHRTLLGGSTVAVIAEIALRLLEPWPLKFVFDRVIPTQPVEGSLSIPALDRLDAGTLLIVAAVAVVSITALRALAAYLGTVGLALVGNRVVTGMRSDLFAHLQRLSLSFHHRARTGDLITRVVGDVGRLQEVAVTAALPLVINTLTLVGMLALMFWMNWKLALIALAILPLFTVISKTHGRRIRKVARRQREREGAMGAAAAETIAAMQVVQSLSLEDSSQSAFARENAGSLAEGVQAKRLSARLERVVDVLIAGGTAMVLLVGGRLVLAAELSPGDLIVFLAYLKNAFKPMRDLAKYTARLAKAGASAERINEILDTTPTIHEAPDAVAVARPINRVAWEGVTFGYDDQTTVLRDVSLDARTGEVVALVGPSGAGKSSLINLLLRLYDPQAGRVTVDGRDLRDCTIRSARGLSAAVPQDAVLFAGTIADNIALGMPDATRADVRRAADLAHATSFIEELADGFETHVAERGLTLSGGQRQRIALARAVVRDAPILVLDEPTSGLDGDSAEQIREALRGLRRDRITFIIAHDLSMVMDADVVVVLDDGRIVERGSPDELLERDGAFASAWNGRGEKGGERALVG